MDERLGLVALRDHHYDNEIPFPAVRPSYFDLIENTEEGEETYPLLTPGGVLAMIGMTGTAKSTILGNLHTAFFSESKEYLNVRCKLNEGSMLWVDTEMPASSDFLYFQKGLHNKLGVKQNIPMYKAISIKYNESNNLRYETLKDIIHNSNNDKDSDYFTNLKVIVIDGIADLLTGTNNLEESTARLNYLTGLADTKAIGTILVIHTDKLGKNAKGHAGSLLTNTAQVVLRTGRYSPNDPFKVECDKMRSKSPFHPFYLEFHENGHDMVLLDDSENVLLDFMTVSTDYIQSPTSRFKIV